MKYQILFFRDKQEKSVCCLLNLPIARWVLKKRKVFGLEWYFETVQYLEIMLYFDTMPYFDTVAKIGCVKFCTKIIRNKGTAFDTNTQSQILFLFSDMYKIWQQFVYKQSWPHAPGSTEIMWYVRYFFFICMFVVVFEFSRAYIYLKTSINRFTNSYFSFLAY